MCHNKNMDNNVIDINNRLPHLTVIEFHEVMFEAIRDIVFLKMMHKLHPEQFDLNDRIPELIDLYFPKVIQEDFCDYCLKAYENIDT